MDVCAGYFLPLSPQNFTIAFCVVAFITEQEVLLTLPNPIFPPPAYFPALIYFGREKGWWITCNYPTVLKEKNKNRKSTTCAICWLKSALHVFVQHYDFPVPDAFPHVVRTLANR
jgi:hypothetical protein